MWSLIYIGLMPRKTQVVLSFFNIKGCYLTEKEMHNRKNLFSFSAKRADEKPAESKTKEDMRETFFVVLLIVTLSSEAIQTIMIMQ